MTDEQFDALVGRLEERARQNPARYKLNVYLLALLGNVYIGAVLLLVIALLAGLVASVTTFRALAVKLILVVGVFLWMVVKALWVKIDPPSGLALDAGQAPELFAMIEELRRRLGAPRFHHVLITDDFNAAVTQSPRLGLFGWDRNYLLLGLPLLQSLTAEQFKAVLAHEFGHLAKGHGRMTHWIYRQRRRWSRLLEVLEESESKGSFLFKPFLHWFTPYFGAYSFPLARADEYEADAISARLSSPRAAAEALTQVDVVGSYLAERYWPDVQRQADEHPQPAFAPFGSLGLRVAAELDEASARGWLAEAMARQTTSSDTHPALRERLAALGEAPRLALPAPGQAADRLLGEALPQITESLDRGWQEAVRPSWEERHQEVQEGRSRLADLDARHAAGAELTLQEAYDRAVLTESMGNDADAALDQLRALHQRAPDEAVVTLAFGGRLLARGDEAGCALVQRAMERDEDLILQGCVLLRDHHWRGGRPQEAQAWNRRLIERTELLQAAAKERNQIHLDDRFEPHGLSAEDLEALRAQLRDIPALHRAYLVTKRVRHFAERPLYVLAVSIKEPLRQHDENRETAVVQQILNTVRLPGEVIAFSVDGENSGFGRKFRWMQGARVI